ncbi:hypothetical protein B0H19DRAFT_1061576 [Mycena capillaripes]|nr:hypothetical protein B0H19DRAFT_1061576 [Mycena capillaripes]
MNRIPVVILPPPAPALGVGLEHDRSWSKSRSASRLQHMATNGNSLRKGEKKYKGMEDSNYWIFSRDYRRGASDVGIHTFLLKFSACGSRKTIHHNNPDGSTAQTAIGQTATPRTVPAFRIRDSRRFERRNQPGPVSVVRLALVALVVNAAQILALDYGVSGVELGSRRRGGVENNLNGGSGPPVQINTNLRFERGSKEEKLRSESDGVLTGASASLPEMQKYYEKTIYRYG